MVNVTALALTITSKEKHSPSKQIRITLKSLNLTLVQGRLSHIQQERSSVFLEPHGETLSVDCMIFCSTLCIHILMAYNVCVYCAMQYYFTV